VAWADQFFCLTMHNLLSVMELRIDMSNRNQKLEFIARIFSLLHLNVWFRSGNDHARVRTLNATGLALLLMGSRKKEGREAERPLSV
jgi:hypothetical protein